MTPTRITAALPAALAIVLIAENTRDVEIRPDQLPSGSREFGRPSHSSTDAEDWPGVASRFVTTAGKAQGTEGRAYGW
ncbi:hypothetical protein AB0903_21835 [Streptomyces sp. NPDC048389]|uniref:hypothetical protein n=1 Tax=Streptomyces sp. NPDC048389 TaxID=3154622 RepID=UPI003451B9CD